MIPFIINTNNLIIMSAYSQVSQLKDIISILQDNLYQITNKSTVQRQLYNEYTTIFQKFSKNLILLASKMTEHAAKIDGKNSDSAVHLFKFLSQLLGKIANSAKNVAVKAKNQVTDPLKLFNDNYTNLNKTFLASLKEKQQQLSEKYMELFKYKENYIAASEKQEKNKKAQGKLMMKIENGDLAELQKFNNNIKKITEHIKMTEDQYAYSVKNVNKSLQELRKDLKQITASLAYNEESRISFTKKALLSSIKNLKELSPDYSIEMEAKLETDLAQIQKLNNQSFLNNQLNSKVALLTSSHEKEEFISYEEMLKKKRKKMLEEQNSHLTEIFSKIKQEDRTIIRNFLKTWFNDANSTKMIPKGEENIYTPQQWQVCRRKIISVLPYSYFFIETIYEEITQMSSIYCKLSEENFVMLLQLFTQIIQNLKLTESGSTSSISVEFAYRIFHISMRVMLKKNTVSVRSQPIELLCQHLGKKCLSLQNEQIFIKLYTYLQKKKISKKAPASTETPKSMMSSFVKGMQQAMNIKKEAKLTEQELFSCLIQLTYMMANLLTPNEVAIPVIKKLLGKGENSRSFQYLKSILLEKKDQQQRQKIFFRTEVKGKLQAKMKNIIQKKQIAQYCLKIAARRGFFNKSEINLRLVCKSLRNIHQSILYEIEMIPSQKWIHLIPHNKKINYSEFKKQIEKATLAPAVQQIIVLDVNRSLHNHTDVLSQDLLRHLLRSYACYHTEIGYCQGMNYIAGYLYIKTSDEEKAYRMFEYLMQTRFKQLFANQFEVLKVKLYQFERLLAIFHPEISEHFKRQGITPQCYIVAWIITIFASSYQYTQESYFIDLLWQRFIIWGWREFFRFVLGMFSIYKDQIIELTYDKAMHFLGAIAKSDLIKSNKEEYTAKYGKDHLEQLVEQYQISQELLETLAKQYDLK